MKCDRAESTGRRPARHVAHHDWEAASRSGADAGRPGASGGGRGGEAGRRRKGHRRGARCGPVCRHGHRGPDALAAGVLEPAEQCGASSPASMARSWRRFGATGSRSRRPSATRASGSPPSFFRSCSNRFARRMRGSIAPMADWASAWRSPSSSSSCTEAPCTCPAGLGQGATFTVRLPRASGATALVGEASTLEGLAHRDGRPARFRPVSGGSQYPAGGRRDRHADDVSRRAGSGRRARSGLWRRAEAGREAEQWRPDLIVTDLGLPGMDGSKY